jgi:tellurite resistance protein TerC
MVSPIFWIAFFVLVAILLVLDLFVFHKNKKDITVRSALRWSVFWIGLAVLFNLGVWYFFGKVKAFEFFTAYLLEESLSVDNLFVFIMIFSFFKIEGKYQHGILFWGIIGAIIFRAIFIFAGVALINKFDWIMYVFGGFLLYTGVKMFFKHEDEKNFNPNENVVVKLFRRFFPVTDNTSSHTLFVRKNKKLYATTFFIALLFIEASDIIFAVDSVPAVLSVSNDVFIVYTSNIFAILGLRSLYFALSGIMPVFHYLKYALAGILSFIGFKMCLNEFSKEFGAQFDFNYSISNYASLGVILSLLTLSIVASLIWKKKD